MELRYHEQKNVDDQKGTLPAQSVEWLSCFPLRRLTSALAIRLETNLVFQGISSDQSDRLRADGPDRKRDIGMSRCQSRRIREWYVPASLLTGI
jgi:hypothetical protein